MTEAQFTRTVIDFARLHGWKVAHFRPGRALVRGRETYRTPVAGDGKGFPDLLLLRPGRGVVVAELKVGRNGATPEQDDWLAAFEAAGVPAYTWRPEEWPEIESVLTGRDPNQERR